MGFLKDFKAFLMKGDIIALATAVIIGGAFNKIVGSLVKDIIMPVIGVLMGGKNVNNLFFSLDGGEYETVDAAGVSIAGSMNNWTAGANLMTLESDTSTVYSTTLLLTTGDAHYYKFVNGQSWESGTNLADCGSGDGYGGFNRTYTVGASDETLAAVCYTACTTCSGEEPVTASVTFQANMSTLLSYGFSDDVHTLNMMGDPNGWTPGDDE